MIWELARIDVKLGAEAGFEAAVARAAPLFRASPGCRHMRLHRSVEDSEHYYLLVGWDTVADHMVGFRASPAYQQWRELVGQYFNGSPVVTHLTSVLDMF